MFMCALFSGKSYQSFAPLFKNLLEPYHDMIITERLFFNNFLPCLLVVRIDLAWLFVLS
jgi:hypothetical protein